MKRAGEAWLDSIDPGQRDSALFSVDSDAWHRWSNIHVFLMRHGAMMESMAQDQRDLAFGLLREGFSSSGFELARNIMKLNDSIREITGSDEELGEGLYWLSVLGEPSLDEPWGWQFDGHHLNVNCFLLGGQMVMTPMFMGSEPVAVEIGKHAGTRGLPGGRGYRIESCPYPIRGAAKQGDSLLMKSPPASSPAPSGIILRCAMRASSLMTFPAISRPLCSI